MSCQLTTDCLNEIFEYLNDKKTLHSCLLVNRLFCKISIRILWRDIFNIKYTTAYKHIPKVSSAILSTLVACLSNESKELLFKNGIFISTPTSKPPLFNYPKFCKVLSITRICLIIDDVLKDIPNNSLSLGDKNFLVTNEVIKMFMTQISSLKKLTFNDDNYMIFPNEITSYFSGVIDCLTDLSELRCNLRIPSEFFYRLSKICHNLHSLTIDINFKNIENLGFLDGLKELISLQNNLKFLKLSASYEGNWTNIIPTLTKHSNTLTKLHLNSDCIIDLPVSFIALFSNLKEIKFSYTSLIFGGIQFKDFEKLQNVTFPKLKYLSIPYKCTKPGYIIKFLENNGKNLEKFYLDEVDHALNLSIVKFCPNLKKLFIILKHSELDILRTIFISCQYLESIKVWCGTYWLKEKQVLETIANHSPKNFCKLKICHYSDSELLSEDLESFFISWKNRPSFTLINFKCGYIGLEESEENLEMIKKYNDLGIIKKFETKYL
ncbi:hypothetical protein C1645_823686 [Glomus cerebriforme]|uniref:F-box domain-containing protein n=1 Tax=Glomus cerebriforme TaxID=658196 RepID=A0A397SZV6_9GLOM|nr:hypothetical protein C1645_823686 [Glomus cerebriforme]